ncbi:MAG: energy-coupling factor transporter transmembrane component T [Nitrososphaerota archaeon]|nr:energy-coupling factor transporter transmembrane protein EcfT [Nitrososphaerales archaeon]MDW8044529.1 energy-coupling factor transporter transmembrane component T [Nitrososphaerota archaeon]
MYWIASGFLFRRTDSIIQRLDPRVRLLISLMLFTLALISDSLIKISITLLTIVSLALMGRILKRMGRTTLLSSTFAIFIFLINLLLGYGLIVALVLALRFVAIITSTSFFFLTTSPDELEYVMKWFRLPQDIIFAFVTAVRFVPVLMIDALQIIDAQRSRGLELDKGRFHKRVKNFIPILVPLVIDAIMRSSELAEAMEVRAYGATKRPTSLYVLKMRNRDKIAIVLSIILFVFAIYSYMYFSL